MPVERPAAAHPYAAHIAEASQRFGIPEHWIRAVLRAESAGDVRAVSSAGAMGLMQVMPDTWAGLRVRHGLGRDPYDSRDNILAGTAYLREMFDRYGNVGAMLAAYNAGPGRLREAGFTRYHHNLETAESHFTAICTTHTYADAVASLRNARAAGLRLCSGGILGLGESRAQRVELALTLAELNVDSVPINFLQAIPGTPLEHMPPLAPMEALRALALFRLLHPGKDVLVCGGRTHVLREWQSWIFAAGANGLMTGNYLTTAGNTPDADNALLAELGLPRTTAGGTPCHR